jgi:hypothetical protein
MKTVITLLTIVASMLLLIRCNKECIKSERCYMKPDPGPCKAYIPKYYYDVKEKKSKQFIWGGCDGVVPFNSMEECEKVCGCE